jgi:chromosome condensin MukBEF ATPase and DNA-binding subunit MukB
MSTTADADAEDVNDFLKRIQELGTRRDQEDEERNRKLEEEILQGRKERQARRAGSCTPVRPFQLRTHCVN